MKDIHDYVGREVKIGDKEGEITKTLAVQFLKVEFFNLNDGTATIDVVEIDKYLLENQNNNLCPFEEVKELIKKIQAVKETINTTDEEYFDSDDLKILAKECSELILICDNTIGLIKESEE